jgi:hypothetical protein
MGYLFSPSDTLINPSKNAIDDPYLLFASKAGDLESIRTWALWLQNRGDYYKRQKCDKIANLYMAQIDSLASKANLR